MSLIIQNSAWLSVARKTAVHAVLFRVTNEEIRPIFGLVNQLPPYVHWNGIKMARNLIDSKMRVCDHAIILSGQTCLMPTSSTVYHQIFYTSYTGAYLLIISSHGFQKSSQKPRSICDFKPCQSFKVFDTLNLAFLPFHSGQARR
jgi:hypothetical protein